MGHELAVTGLVVRYGMAKAVTDVALEIPGGQVTAIVGPNGAGKSSLFLAVYGSIPSTGSVRVDGEEINRLSATRRAGMGIALVPQGRQLFPRLTVRENLQVMAEVLRLRRDAVDAALDRFPILRERSKMLAGVLSGGEQQMLVVARALMGSPRVLLLDEMTTGLAPMIIRSLGATVAELAATGVAVAIAEPSIGSLRQYIDRGYVMLRGEIAAAVEERGHVLDAEYQRLIGVGH